MKKKKSSAPPGPRPKKRRRRRRGPGILISLLCLVLICAAILAAVTVFFKVKRVTVSGESRYSAEEVLEAAGSKWNFLPFRPGLVGGHCIGVDPYYLTYKAEELGFHPEVILAGRRINDNMGKYVAECVVKRLIKSGRVISGARVGILGFTFKENVPDLRNTRVVDVVRELEDYGVTVLVSDAEADPEEALREYGQTLLPQEDLHDLDGLILAVSHKAYAGLTPAAVKALFAAPDNAVVLDVKSFFDAAAMRAAGIDYWRL